jgi:hypothetical protein
MLAARIGPSDQAFPNQFSRPHRLASKLIGYVELLE